MAIWRAQKEHNASIKLRGGGDEYLILDKLTDKTATTQDVEVTKVESTGTAAANLGAGFPVQIENAAGEVEERGSIDHVMTTATNGSEGSEYQFRVSSSGTVTKIATINASGLTLNSGSLTVTTPGTTDFTGGAATINLKAATDAALDIQDNGTSAFEIDTSGDTIQSKMRFTTTDGVSSGTARVVGGLAYSNVAASAAHTSTTTEALFDKQYSLPANTLKAGTLVKIKYQGIATGTANTDTLAIVLYIGGLSGTALLTGTATDVANNAIFCGEYNLICRTAGTSGTFVGFGSHSDVPAASGTASPIYEINASTTINTTAAQVIGVGADWSTTDTVNTCRLDFLTVEVY